MHGNRIETTHEYLRRVLVHRSFAIGDEGNVFDDDAMVRLLAGLVQNPIRFDHVVDDITLGYLLRTKLLRSGEILSVVVAKVIIADNRPRLKSDYLKNQ